MKQTIVLGFMLAGMACAAQKKDSVMTMKLFFKVCNSYKAPPVLADVEISNSTNYILEEADTSHLQARFCLRKDGSYIGIGDIEQIADDSALLLVDSRQKRMLVYPHRNSVVQEMQAVMGWQTRDSSMKSVMRRFSVVAGGGDTAEIILKGRELLKGSPLEREVVLVRYDPVRLQPYMVTQISRRLVPLSEEDYRRQSLAPGARAELYVHADEGWYIVHERVSVFRYARILHQEDLVLPVTITQRVVKDQHGHYQAVASYKDYDLGGEL